MDTTRRQQQGGRRNDAPHWSLTLCGGLVFGASISLLLWSLLLLGLAVMLGGCRLHLSAQLHPSSAAAEPSAEPRRLATWDAAQLLLDWQVMRQIMLDGGMPREEFMIEK